MSHARPSVAIIGPGKVGRTLARALERAGYEVVALVGRMDDKSPVKRAGLVLVTVADDDVALVFSSLADEGVLRPEQVVFHFSGLVKSCVLEAPHLTPAGRAAVHPMMAFADVDRALEALPGITYGVEGDGRGIEEARRLVEDLGGKVVIVPAEAKAAYHLACVMASNGLVAMMDAAEEVGRSAGVQGEGLVSGLANLVLGTAGNVSRLGIRPAMTGPVVRGDSETVARHLEVLEKGSPGILEAYKLLLRRFVKMATESGRGDPDLYQPILDLIE
ncbi:MAG: DUF2520 domain-containing protein [Deltaproteobacteria bacterium]|nr:DUF2520 domain-containing protein [Deltaproteobacteria bacterium]